LKQLDKQPNWLCVCHYPNLKNFLLLYRQCNWAYRSSTIYTYYRRRIPVTFTYAWLIIFQKYCQEKVLKTNHSRRCNTKNCIKIYSLFKRELHQNSSIIKPRFWNLRTFQKIKQKLDRFFKFYSLKLVIRLRPPC
jgi:hypothetical protein